MAILKILNPDIEIASFPITQSFKISSTIPINEDTLENTILLFRMQTKDKLINLAEPYSYTLGYIKESFDVLPLDFKVEPLIPIGYKITCTPKKALNVNAKYCLYVTRNVIDTSSVIDKIVTKSKSSIKVQVTSPTDFIDYTVKITSTSLLTNTSNTVNLTVNNIPYTLNLNNKTSIKLNGIEIYFNNEVYVKDEVFKVTVIAKEVLEEDLQQIFYTTTSTSITPLENIEASTTLSNLDVINFYQELNEPIVTPLSLLPTYLDVNVFSLKVPEGYVLDITDIKADLSIAFNSYSLKNLDLYTDNHKYKVIIYKDDFEDEYIFEVIYSTDLTQVDKVVIDTSNIG